MSSAHSVDAAVAAARLQGLSRLDAQALLAHHLGRPRSWLLAHGEAPLAAAVRAAFDADAARRADGVPLAYLVGEREFHGLALAVSPAVLVPRPETELLVDWGLECLAGPLAGRNAPQIVDLGTGSGAIALALARGCQRARVHGVERSDDALAVARANGGALGVTVQWHLGSWWEPLRGLPVDLALANPPYVAVGDPHLLALRHEPTAALVAGPDGLDALRAIVSGAAAALAHGGFLLLEHGHDQDSAVVALLAGAGFADIRTRVDLAGVPRCTGGHLA